MIKHRQMELLIGFGFTQVEASVYYALLKESPQSGYKISSDIGKARSNVYQALRSLAQKGAVVKLQGGKSGSFRAISIEQLLKQKENEFASRKTEMQDAFKNLDMNETTDEIYNLLSIEQVYTKAQDIISNSKKIIFVDIQKIHFAQIEPELRKAAARNVKIVIYSSDDIKIPGCDLIRFEPFDSGDRPYEEWPITWFCLAADAEQFLIVTTRKNSENLIHALYSRNRFIAGWIFSDMLYQIGFNNIVSMFNRKCTREEIHNWITDYTSSYVDIAPGIVELKRKYRDTQ